LSAICQPTVENLVAGLATSGTCSCGAGRREGYLEYYLDEFTFRFNRRTSRSRGQLFQRLMEQAVAVDPVPYKKLVEAGETWWNSDHQIQRLLESTK
jgi:hypothetical protein